MRGPRLSFSDEFRDEWDKENKDPIKMEFSPRTIRSRIPSQVTKDQLETETQHVARTPRPLYQTWLDDLLKQ